MALHKYYETYEQFKSDKVSDSADNTSYYDWENATSVYGTPNVEYNTICFIADQSIIYTHGQKYTSAASAGITQEDVEKLISDHKKSNPKGIVTGLGQYALYGNDNVKIRHYAMFKDDNNNYSINTSYNTYIARATDQPTYIPQYGNTYTDSDGNTQTYMSYYPNGIAGLMGVKDVVCMWQSWHAVNNIPNQLVGYFGTAYTTPSAVYLTSYGKTEDGTEYPVINTTTKKKEYGSWKVSNIEIPTVSSNTAGVMTNQDKIKLDTIENISDFSTTSVDTPSTYTYLWSNYEPNGENFVKTQYIDFQAGDRLYVDIDLSGCEKTEDCVFSIGTKIDGYGRDLEKYAGVFHFYHQKSDSTEVIQCDYVDNTYKIHFTSLDVSTTQKLTIEMYMSFDNDSKTMLPTFKMNDQSYSEWTTTIGQSTLSNWMYAMKNIPVQLGSASESEATGKTSTAKYNYVTINNINNTGDNPGVSVNYIYGTDEKSFIIPIATETSHGVMSKTDKVLLSDYETLKTSGGVIGETSTSYTYIGGTTSYSYYQINSNGCLINKTKKNGNDLLITTSNGTAVSEVYNQVKGNNALIGVNQYKNNFAASMSTSYTTGMISTSYANTDNTLSTSASIQCNTGMSIISSSYSGGSNSNSVEIMSTSAGNFLDFKKDGTSTVTISNDGITIGTSDLLDVISKLEARISALESK